MLAPAARALTAGAVVVLVGCSGSAFTSQTCPSCDDGGTSTADGSLVDGPAQSDGTAQDSMSPDASAHDGSSRDGSPGPDGSMASDASDGSATTDGPTSSDGASSDAIADARTVASGDACVGSGTEECFNGVDDDCNGLVDCADPACQPVAECVPVAPGFSYAAEVAAGGACPAHFGASALDLSQGLNAPATCTGCGCTSTLTCTNILTEGAAGTCPPITPVTPIDVSSLTCQSISLSTGNASTQATVTHTSCGYMGTPAPAPLSWGAQTKACETASVGGGCATGNVCVAKAAKHCVTTPGTFACTAGYSVEGAGGPWYTGVTDTRSCGNTCGCTKSGGSCGTSYVEIFTASGCGSGTTTAITNGAVACGLPVPLYQSATVVVTPDAVQPTCSPAYGPMTGGASATGAQTLCCQ